MMTAPADRVEAEARRLLQERIERLPWYPRMKPHEREAAIRADLDRYWRVMQPEAIHALQATFATTASKQAA